MGAGSVCHHGAVGSGPENRLHDICLQLRERAREPKRDAPTRLCLLYGKRDAFIGFSMEAGERELSVCSLACISHPIEPTMSYHA